jgi:plasmid stabilization system protein ParE
MKLRVRTTPDADDMITELDVWWSENRPAAPTLVIDELNRVLDLLSENPDAGRPHRHRRIRGLRKHRLQGTPYLVYYVPDFEAGELIVVALWSAMRKHGPPLTAP